MMRGVLALLLSFLLLCPAVFAEQLFRVGLLYQVQTDSVRHTWVGVDDGSLLLKPGMSGTAFLGDAAVTLVIATAGERQSLVDFTLTTLPPAARVVSRQLVLDETHPIEVFGLKYQLHREARVQIRVKRAEGEIDCDFGSDAGARTVDEFLADVPFHGAPSMKAESLNLEEDQVWYVDPSAHFEIHYIPNTLGDYAWNTMRDYLEKEYEQFEGVFNLHGTQRTNYFIAPCKVPEIAWTPHRTWAIDPVTFKAYALYNREEKEISGIPTNMNQLYRHRGYAPMMLVEGAARGFEFNHYYAKKLKWRGRVPHPMDYWPTLKYRNAADSNLQIAAGSFVNYLIGTRGLDKFFVLYSVADDFNADSVIQAVYNEKPDKLQREWLHFLDTMRVRPHMLSYFISRSKALGRNDESIELMRTQIEVDTVDVTPVQEDLALLYFLEGRYQESVDLLDDVRQKAPAKPRYTQMQNSALFFLGDVDRAREGYRRDLNDTGSSSFGAVGVMYGWLEYTEGNLAKSDSLFRQVESRGRAMDLDRVEANLYLGRLKRLQGGHAAADSCFREALNAGGRLLQARPGTADMHMRVGEAYVGLGAADTALIYLNMAEFLEYRPYYIGRVLVAIGNAYDLLRMRDQAVAYYKRVLETPTSYPSRVEARRYLKEPFKPGRA